MNYEKMTKAELISELKSLKPKLKSANNKYIVEEKNISHNLLNAIFERTTDAVFVKDLQGRYVLINSAGANIMGKKIEEIIGKDDTQLFPNDIACKLMEEDQKIIVSGKKITFDEEVPKHGKISIFNTLKTPRFDYRGNIIGVIGIARDITERRKAEEELLVKNSYLRLLQVSAVIANKAEDIKDAFQPVLEEICCYTGWEIGHAYTISENNPDLLKPTEVWSLGDKKQFMDFCSVTKKTDFPKGIGLPGRVLASCKPHWIIDVTKDNNFLRAEVAKALKIKSGIAFPVMVGTSVVAVLEFFTTETLEPDKQFMNIMDDIGTQLGRIVERKKADERIKWLARFPSENPNYVLRVFSDGRILYNNQASMVLLDSWGCRTTKMMPDNFLKIVSDVLHSGLSEVVEVECNNCVFSLTFAPIIEEGYVNVYGLDITESKQVDKAIQTLVKSIVGKTGQEFFDKIVVSMNEWLGTHCAFVGQITNGNNVKALSMQMDGNIIHDYGYTIGDGPCEVVVKDGYQVYKEKVCELFPKNKVLSEIGAEGYVGAVLRDKNSNTIGIIWVVSRKKLNIPVRTAEVIDILAAKASSEIERKGMEEALLHAEKMKAMGIMTAGVAHEFNNILAVISSNAQLLAETKTSDKELSKSLQTICRAADDGTEIVDRMYDFTEIRKDKSQHVKTDLDDIIKQVIDFTMPGWKKIARSNGTNYHIERKSDKKVPDVFCNPSEIREVILNIMKNAMDAMPDGGTLTVETRRVRPSADRAGSKKENVSELLTQNSELKGDFVEITFADTGEGMSEEVKQKIFDPFFTTRSPEGTGLGMSITYGIIARHGGKINIESELGNGSKITISLPVIAKTKKANNNKQTNRSQKSAVRN